MEKCRKISASENAYALIKERILTGKYAPNSVLNEIALSSELGVSRTPVRAALSKLEHEMLVKVYPKYGTIVSPVDLDVVHDVFQIRRLLEPFIILNYGVMIDRKRILMALKAQQDIRNQQSTINFHYKADADLHQIILDANPNRYVTETLLKVYDQIQRFRILTGTNSTERLLKSCEEHLEIINNLLCSNYQAAAKKMDDHLTASWQATINLVIYNDNGVQPSLRR